MEVEPTVLAVPEPSSADSLVSSNDPDDMANEQTWPTEEEMQDTEDPSEPIEDPLAEAVKGTTPKRIKRIPKGMSEYQASWIIDESEDEDGDEDGSEQDMEDVEEEEMQDIPVPEDDEDMELENRKGLSFQDLDVTEESKQWVLVIIFFLVLVHNPYSGSKVGAIVVEKKKMLSCSLTKSTHRKKFPREHDSSAIAV
jgi:pre-rRNA-processing protein TSR1